jgi:uncharacterized protein DUF4185
MKEGTTLSWRWQLLLSSWVLATAPVQAAPPSPFVPSRSEAAPEWDARFAGKRGWIGGDGVYSAVLGPRRLLWLFGDTLLGEVKKGGRAGEMVNNSIAIQEGRSADSPLRFIAGKAKGGKPVAFLAPEDGKGRFWPQSALRVGSRLHFFLAQTEKTTEPGAFGFRHVGQWLGVVDNPDEKPESWRVRQLRIPFAEFKPGRARSWGSAVLADGGQMYVYGYREQGQEIGKRYLTVARVPAAKVDTFKAWRFRTVEGWSEDAAAAVPLAGGLATEFSVSRLPRGRGYVAVYTENGLGDRIVGRFAERPWGPWSAPVLLYRCPEMGRDKGVFCYAAKAHPWASAGDSLLVSYCVNAWKFARLFQDDAVYRPRFVRVELRPAK